jgi:hypothetical protein
MGIVVIGLFAGTLHLGFKAGWIWGKHQTRCTAVAAGVARWEANPVTGEAEFTWIGKEKP